MLGFLALRLHVLIRPYEHKFFEASRIFDASWSESNHISQ